MIKKFWRMPLALVSLIVVPGWASAQRNDLDSQLAAIEKGIEDARLKLGVPGVALAIVQGDRVILSKGFGHRDLEKQLPVTPNTLFAIGSCTKAFTAMSAVIAQDEKKLSLEDSPKKYLPYFAMKNAETDRAITLRDLLTHRTGIGRFDLAWGTGVLNREEVIKVTAWAEPTAKLREKFQYQNAMYSAAGEAVAAAYKTRWGTLIAERFFKPLNMRSSNTSVADMQRTEDFALGYNADPQNPARVLIRALANIAPAGAINSNVTDMAQWLKLLVAGGEWNGRRLISEKGFAEVLKPQQLIYGDVNYGLGWNLHQWHGHRVAVHGGGIDGYNSIVAVMPEQKLGLVLLTNVSSSPLPQQAHELVLEQLIGVPETSAAENSTDKPAQPPPPPKPVVPEGLPSVDELHAKIIEAAGGEARLRQLTATTQQYTLEYENLGMQGEMKVALRTPNNMTQDATIVALGKTIGTISAFFDGTRAEQSTSFSNKDVMTGVRLEEARLMATFNEVLQWKTLYKQVAVTNKLKMEDDEVYVIIKTPFAGHAIVESYSTADFRLKKRDRALTTEHGPVPSTESFSDYRVVDGVAVPFRTVTWNPYIGRISAKLEKVEFERFPIGATVKSL